MKSLSAEVRFKPLMLEQKTLKNVKTQEVKPIHKMSQRPEISRRYVRFPEDLEDTPHNGYLGKDYYVH